MSEGEHEERTPAQQAHHEQLRDWMRGALMAGMRITYTEWRHMTAEERDALAEAGYEYHSDMVTKLALFIGREDRAFVERAVALGETEELSTFVEDQAFSEFQRRRKG